MNQTPRHLRRVEAGRGFACRLYGLNITSELWLGLPAVANGSADLMVRLRPEAGPGAFHGRLVAWAPCQTHGVDIRVWRSPDGAARVWNRAVATFDIHPDTRAVDVYPEPGADPRAIRAVLLGPIVTFVLHRRGWPTLHASGVLVDGQVVAFVGAQGQGKSTLAAGFVARGHWLFTDDILPLRPHSGSVQAMPGPPHLKLWPDAAERLVGRSAGLPDVLPGLGKKLVAAGARPTPGPAPIGAVYILDRRPVRPAGSGDIRVGPLRGHPAAAALLAHTPNRSYLLPPEEAAFLPVYARLVNQGLVRRLEFPAGLDRLDEVCRQILADLG